MLPRLEREYFIRWKICVPDRNSNMQFAGEGRSGSEIFPEIIHLFVITIHSMLNQKRREEPTFMLKKPLFETPYVLSNVKWKRIIIIIIRRWVAHKTFASKRNKKKRKKETRSKERKRRKQFHCYFPMNILPLDYVLEIVTETKCKCCA